MIYSVNCNQISYSAQTILLELKDMLNNITNISCCSENARQQTLSKFFGLENRLTTLTNDSFFSECCELDNAYKYLQLVKTQLNI